MAEEDMRLPSGQQFAENLQKAWAPIIAMFEKHRKEEQKRDRKMRKMASLLDSR